MNIYTIYSDLLKNIQTIIPHKPNQLPLLTLNHVFIQIIEL